LRRDVLGESILNGGVEVGGLFLEGFCLSSVGVFGVSICRFFFGVLRLCSFRVFLLAEELFKAGLLLLSKILSRFFVLGILCGLGLLFFWLLLPASFKHRLADGLVRV